MIDLISKKEWSYQKYGKNWKEGLFYTHLLGIPFFFLFLEDLQRHTTMANQSEILFVFRDLLIPDHKLIISDKESALADLLRFVSTTAVPSMLVYLFINVITQYPADFDLSVSSP
jgi:UDP-xylose/UDP-N-acetylglucosamine transporter B4